jgi:hypothetical protein
MADGSSKPISRVKAGDRVADAVPGQAGSQVHTVSKVIVTRTDRDFVDVTVAPVAKGPARRALASAAGRLRSKAKVAIAAAVAVGAVVAGGQPAMVATGHAQAKAPAVASSAGVAVHGGTLTTTFHHPFYDQTQAAFTDAEYLHVGDVLQTPAGAAEVTGVRLFHANTTTYDLTIDGLHTYYVEAGTTPVLVHNCDVGRQVESGSTDLSKATRAARKADNNKGNLYGAARVGKRIFVDHSDENGHAEEYLLQQVRDAGFQPEHIDELYTEYGMCPRCQGPGGSRAVLPLLRNDADITYSIPFADPASRPAARAALKALVSSIFP